MEERLKEQSLLVREERVLKTVPERMTPFRELLEQFRRELPIDRTFLSPRALGDLPGKDILTEVNAILEQLSAELEAAASQMAEAIGSIPYEVLCRLGSRIERVYNRGACDSRR